MRRPGEPEPDPEAFYELSLAEGWGDGAPLISRDAPGAYAYQSREQGQRIADNQLQAFEASKEIHVGAGTVRTLAPGTTFALTGQAQFDLAGSDDERSFLVVRTVHLMHNNLSADLKSSLMQRLGQGLLDALIGEINRLLHLVRRRARQNHAILMRQSKRSRILLIRSRSELCDTSSSNSRETPSLFSTLTKRCRLKARRAASFSIQLSERTLSSASWRIRE